TQVSVHDLLQGIIVASGNDACVALAEQIAGTEASFAEIMNQTAKDLGMKNSHFLDSTGLPNDDHYSTAHDLAILARALIHDFPEHYGWYKQKWFKYNGINQPNRNRLLWRDESVDGLKTGHTESAGYCLVASAKRNDTRLIAAVLGANSEGERANDTEALLNFGYHFFESHKVFAANQKLSEPRIWLGKVKNIPMGIPKDFIVTIPAGKSKDVKATMVLNKDLRAPIIKGREYGVVKVTIDDKEIATCPIVALADNPTGGIFKRCYDHIAMLFSSWFGSAA
ncbi:MAG: D-alanyl-D-alanine carboxypeptidase, partial [Pseudomonadota bacterium]|nr:D-alanyl-D-alanine carboxypeptidase [Pseudomonadota bacterium]